MKRNFVLIVLLGLVINISSQIPDGFSYQAVIRGNDKALIKNQTVSIKATIIRNDEALFTQTQTTTTNENGLLTIIIGNEDFQTIDWTEGPLFIKTQIDPSGGDNYSIETETQLLSVPYAMAAKTALSVPDLDLLIEKVNRLEGEVEELKDRVDELEEQEKPVEIIKELPKMYLNGALHFGEHAVIQSQAELFAIFPQEEIEQSPYSSHLLNIDFNTQTLLIGRDDYCYSANFNFEFYLTGKNQYICKVYISGGWTAMDYNFLFGFVVNKLPEDAEVIFNINKEINCPPRL
jgi:hypothetical protein